MFKVWGSCLVAAGALLVASPSFADDCVNSPDINGDGIVDESDFEILKDAFGTNEDDSDFVSGADINGDGLVTTADYAAMLGCS